jgi:uncharacterized membrane protein YbhN (UPF0104 family)
MLAGHSVRCAVPLEMSRRGGFFCPAMRSPSDRSSVGPESVLASLPPSVLLGSMSTEPVPEVEVPSAGNPTGRQRTGRSRVFQLVLLVALLIGLGLFARQIQYRELWAALLAAKLWPLLLVVALQFGSVLCKSIYWTTALAPVARLSVWKSFRLTIASAVASLVVPRGGDAFKVWQLKQQLGVEVPYSLAVTGLEKLGDTTALLLITSPLPWLFSDLPTAARRALILLPTGLVLFVGLLLVVANHPRWAERPWLAGLSLLRSPRILSVGFLWILLAWFCDLAMMRLVLFSVGPTVGPGATLLMMLFINLAIAVPISPGNAGTQELGAVLALTLSGASREAALAVALIHHACQTIPMALAGALDARALVRGRLKLGP